MFLTRGPPDESEARCFARSEYVANSLPDNRAAWKWCFHAGLTMKIRRRRPYLTEIALAISSAPVGLKRLELE
jgi:hypothetical protein